MKRAVLLALLALPAVAAPSPAAQAGFWQWDRESAYSAFCAEQGGEANYRNCGYPTWAACQAAVSGVGGYCYANPQYRPEIAERSYKRRHPRIH